MTHRTLATSAVALFVAFLAPATVLGKGATSGEIAGPGLDDAIVMSGTWNQLGRIAEAGGFYAAAFRQEPSPLLAEQPAGEIGPRYTITYAMPGPDGETDELVQDVYPYAKPAPVTYTSGGQRFFGVQETGGGWFVAAPVLKAYLVAAGLPATAPTDTGGSSFPWALAALVALAVVSLPAALLLRRRAATPAMPAS